jgi:hypothetical protein
MKAQGVPTNNLSIFSPNTILALTPYLNLSLKSSTGRSSCFVFSCGDQMVDTERMRFV